MNGVVLAKAFNFVLVHKYRKYDYLRLNIWSNLTPGRFSFIIFYLKFANFNRYFFNATY